MAIVVAKCPRCEADVTTDDIPQPLRLYVLVAALQVSAAMIDMVMQDPDYASARQNWVERLEHVSQEVERESEEMTVFGEQLDD